MQRHLSGFARAGRCLQNDVMAMAKLCRELR